MWANRHRQHFKQYHRIRYYNLLISGRLYPYLADMEEQAQTMFSQLVKSLAEKNVTEKLKRVILCYGYKR
ncbi:TnpV protein [Peptoniphilaceae bacterium SGI.097]